MRGGQGRPPARGGGSLGTSPRAAEWCPAGWSLSPHEPRSSGRSSRGSADLCQPGASPLNSVLREEHLKTLSGRRVLSSATSNATWAARQEAGAALQLHRNLWDFLKWKVNSASQLSLCFYHLRWVKRTRLPELPSAPLPAGNRAGQSPALGHSPSCTSEGTHAWTEQRSRGRGALRGTTSLPSPLRSLTAQPRLSAVWAELPGLRGPPPSSRGG